MSQILWLLHSCLLSKISVYYLFYSIPVSLFIDGDYLSIPILFIKIRQLREILILRVFYQYIEKFLLVLFGHTCYRTDYPVWYHVPYEAHGNYCMCDNLLGLQPTLSSLQVSFLRIIKLNHVATISIAKYLSIFINPELCRMEYCSTVPL